MPRARGAPAPPLPRDVTGRRPYELVAEPRGDDYAALLEAASAACDVAVLAVPDSGLGPGGRRLVDVLSPLVTARSRAGDRQLLRVRLDPAVVAALTAAASGLFDWRRPRLPENLCLLRSDGGPWLVSAAAERLGVVELTPFERLLLARTSPRLPDLLDEYGGEAALTGVLERSLEDGVSALARSLAAGCRVLLEDRREGLAGALAAWMWGGDAVRSALALEVAAELGLDELADDVAELLAGDAGDADPARRRRLERVAAVLRRGAAG